MKARLLSMFTMVMMAISVHAQWTAPVAPESPIKGVDYEADGTTLYYLYNVGCGQFVTGANSWSTQISLGTNAEPYMEIVVEALDEVDEEEYPGAVKLRLNPNKSQTVNGAGGERSFTGTYLFRDNDTSGFIDHAAQAVWYWNFEKAENGNYYWHSAYNMGFDPEVEYAAGPAEEAAVVFNATAEDANIEWQFVPVDGLDKEALGIFAEAMAHYQAQLDLYNTLLEAQEKGVSTDAASAVYNNSAATIAELNQATANLKADIKEAEFGDQWADASEDNPLDITDDVMVNPSFDNDNGMEGWTIKGATPATATWNAQGPNSTGFMGEVGVDSWGKNCEVFHAAFDISQYIDFLPAGVYKFTCQGFYRPDAVDGVSDNPLIPAELYAIFPDGSEQISNIAHIDDYATVDKLYENGSEWYGDVNRNGKYAPNGMNGAMYHFHHYTGNNEELDYTSVLNIVVTEPIAGITIGVRTTSKRTWVIFDNFKLTYYGKVDPKKLELQDLIKKNQAIYDPDAIRANKEVIENYLAAMDAGEDAEDNYEELLNNLKAATAALVGSIQDYKELDEVYATTRELADKLEAEHQDWPEVTDIVSTLADEMFEKIDDALADHDYLEAVRDSAINTIRNYIASGDKIKEGDDLTILLINADFQKYYSDQHLVPGWEGSIKELSKQWGDIENYGDYGAGHIEQTIKNMPMGAYDITVQGFVRGNYNKVTLFAGDSKTCFKEVWSEYATEPSFGTPEEAGGWPNDVVRELEDGTTAYYPNSMQGAAMAFAKMNPATGELFYTNHCRIVLTKAGDLTIGVDVKEAVDEEIWAIWDNFRITYVGNKADLYADEIHKRQQDIENALQAEDAFITNKAQELATEAILAGDAALKEADIDAIIAALQQMDDVLDYIAEAPALAEELMLLAEYYYIYARSINSGDEEYMALLDKSVAPIGSDFESNEELKEAIAQIKEGWAGYVMYDIKDIAAPDDPQDITEIIYNPDYTDPILGEDSASGWTITNEGGATAASMAELECYNNDSFVVSQDLIGLEPGFYVVGVNGYYRAGFPSASDSLAQVLHAELFATTSVSTWAKPLMNAMDGAQTRMEGIGSESEITLADGSVVYIPNNMEAAQTYLGLGYYAENEREFEVGADGKATIGIRKSEHIDGDWTIFTNWTFYYLGKTPSDGIEEVITSNDPQKAQGAIYDLSGRRVSKMQKGLYIVNGKKVAVK